MAYDIHIGKSKKSHTYKFSIEERDYYKFLNEIKNASMSLHRLSRFGDYYDDTVFRPCDLEGLIEELQLVVEHGAEGRATALALIDIVKGAMEEGLHVFGFAD